jgi:DNA-binding winged helix-turn-helix (wHTH) protein
MAPDADTARGVEHPPARAILVRGDLILDLTRREAVVRSRRVRLTALEFRLLQVLAETPGRAYSRDELLARLHALDGKTPVDRTLDNLVARLRRKLGDNARRPTFIEAVWGLGYRMADRQASPEVVRSRAAAAAFASLPVPAMVIDASRRVLLINAAGRQMWGIDAGDPVQAHCFDVVGCHTHRSASSPISSCPALDALRQGSPVSATYLTKTPGTPSLPVEAAYTPLPQEGDPAACLLLIRPARRKARRRR